jgi:hypothetical protein
MSTLANYGGKLYRVAWLGKTRTGPHKGERRAKLVPLKAGAAFWVSGGDFTLVDYVPKKDLTEGRK